MGSDRFFLRHATLQSTAARGNSNQANQQHQTDATEDVGQIRGENIRIGHRPLILSLGLGEGIRHAHDIFLNRAIGSIIDIPATGSCLICTINIVEIRHRGILIHQIVGRNQLKGIICTVIKNTHRIGKAVGHLTHLIIRDI